MLTWWEGMLGSGHGQAEVARMLMIEASSRLFNMTAIVLLDEIQVVPHDVGAGHAPATDHEGDRQREGS